MPGWTGRYRLSDGGLELLTSRGESLLFEPLPDEARAALEGATWSLLAFVEPNPVEGMPAPLPLTAVVRQGTEITITFEGDTLRGSAGCNGYEAAYALDGSSFTIEAVVSTIVACESPAGVMEQEDRYLGVLRDVTIINVYGGQLWMETGDGRVLVFGAPTGG
jgi:heat shock protein HslJ